LVDVRFVSGIAPVFVFVFIRLAVTSLRVWRAGKGGPKLITLSIPRLRRPEPPSTIVARADAPPAPRKSLYMECVYAHFVRGYEPGEVLIVCGYAFPPREVPFPVRECTDYKPKRKRSGVEIASEGAVNFPPLDN
jgi:hypothetical protein